LNESIVSNRARALRPYTPGEQIQDREYIKLNTNENPYPPSAEIRDLLASYRWQDLRLYPDPKSTKLREALARYHRLNPAKVFTANGSDELLSFIFYAFFDPNNGPVLFPQYSYSFYPVYCRFYGLDFEKVEMDRDFRLDLKRFSTHERYSGIIFPNPNAPTGRDVSLEEIKDLLSKVPRQRLLVVDEAYVDFGAETALPLLGDHPNLLIVRTFSKSRSLAGARIGYALGDVELIETLVRVKDSFNSYPLNRLSQSLAIASIEDEDTFRRQRLRVSQTREWCSRELRRLGWQVIPSKANFLFAQLPGTEGRAIYEDLKSRGILVRHFAQRGIEDYIRISVGTDEEMRVFIDTLEALSLERD